MIRGVLKNLSPTHNNLRTPTVEGLCFSLPTVGERFGIIGDALEGKGERLVLTSRVVDVDGNRFWTRNSWYEFEATL